MSQTSSPSLEKLVRDTVHRAYWDVLASELHADPPIYGHAIKLLEEIKEVSLLSFGLTTKVQEYPRNIIVAVLVGCPRLKCCFGPGCTGNSN